MTPEDIRRIRASILSENHTIAVWPHELRALLDAYDEASRLSVSPPPKFTRLDEDALRCASAAVDFAYEHGYHEDGIDVPRERRGDAVGKVEQDHGPTTGDGFVAIEATGLGFQGRAELADFVAYIKAKRTQGYPGTFLDWSAARPAALSPAPTRRVLCGNCGDYYDAPREEAAHGIGKCEDIIAKSGVLDTPIARPASPAPTAEPPKPGEPGFMVPESVNRLRENFFRDPPTPYAPDVLAADIRAAVESRDFWKRAWYKLNAETRPVAEPSRELTPEKTRGGAIFVKGFYAAGDLRRLASKLDPNAPEPSGYTRADLEACVRQAYIRAISLKLTVKDEASIGAMTDSLVTRYLAGRPATPTTDTEKK